MSLITDLISYYKLDEASGDALDAHDTNDLADINTVGTDTGIINNAREFQASEYFDGGDANDLDMGTDDFSVSLWFNTENATSANALVAKADMGSGTSVGWGIFILANDVYIHFNDAGGVIQDVVVNNLVDESIWYHLVINFDRSGNATAWLDGVQASSVNISGKSGSIDNSVAFRLGINSNSTQFPYAGLMDEIGIWRRLLTEQEIEDLYNAGDGLAYEEFGGGASSVAVTGTAVASIDEADIVAGGKTIILTLTGDMWLAAGALLFDLIRQDIIDGLDSAQSELLGWDNVVKGLQGTTGVVRTSDTVVTITLDAQATYNITAQETIEATVPASALQGGIELVGTPTFTVDAVGGAVVPYRTLMGVGV